MKATLKALIFVAPLLLAGAKADAQTMFRRGSSVVIPAAVESGTTNLPSVATYGVIVRPTVGTTYVPPYSYQVLPNAYPKRHYSGYGTNDFPFYGQPYGHSYDAWTWPYLSGGYNRGMARYFYPPL